MIQIREVVLAASISPPSMRILLPYIAVALTLMTTQFYHAALKKRHGDARGTWLYFLLFFTLLAALPLLLILLAEDEPLQALSELGVGWGEYRIGGALMLVFVPIALLIGHVISKTEEMKDWYPFSKEVCTSDGRFILYETGYLLLYYTAWEFLYRGMLFFPLAAALGFLPAMALNTALSTLHHIGHPKSEVFGALLAGIVFSCIALWTRSVLYPIVIHATIGVVNDTFIYLRTYRNAAGR
ncbi:MAG: CPBP family intramembrane metalloprotease [Spirochaetales bacterium]|nr:CPBP family intramembrane metalloprotease [Spirochaetales bacterium]